MKSTGKKVLALILALLMLLALAACGGKTAAPETKDDGRKEEEAPKQDIEAQSIGDGGTMTIETEGDAVENDRTLYVAVSQDSGTLYPYSCTAFGFTGVARTFQDTLYDYTSGGDIEYLLCTGWEEAEGENEYIMHLREGVKFTNGNPFTASDVIFSMQVSHEHPQYFSNVDTIDFEKTKIIDDYTIDLWFTRFDVGQFPGMMLMYIFDEESFDIQAMATQSIGTGPYIVTEYVTNSYVRVTANPDYWGDPPAIKNIEFDVIDEAQQKVNALTVGKLDFAGITSDDVELVEGLSKYRIWATLSGSCNIAYFNCSPDGPLNTVEKRKAICYAIDRQNINDILFDGYSTLPRWANTEACLDFDESFIDPEDDVYSVGYDPDLARSMVEELGMKGTKLRIMTNGSERYITMAEIVEQNLKDVGLDAEIINYDQATYWGLLMDPTNFDIAMYMNGSPKNMCLDLFPAYLEFFSLGLEGDPVRDAFVDLGNKGLATPDEAERDKILNQLGRDFNKLTAWYAICENLGFTAVDKDLGTIVKYNDGESRYAHWYWVN